MLLDAHARHARGAADTVRDDDIPTWDGQVDRMAAVIDRVRQHSAIHR